MSGGAEGKGRLRASAAASKRTPHAREHETSWEMARPANLGREMGARLRETGSAAALRRRSIQTRSQIMRIRPGKRLARHSRRSETARTVDPAREQPMALRPSLCPQTTGTSRLHPMKAVTTAQPNRSIQFIVPDQRVYNAFMAQSPSPIKPLTRRLS